MTAISIRLFHIIQRPIYQALIFFLLIVPVVLILSPKEADQAWLIVGYCFFCFLLVNVTILWFTTNAWRYFFHSISFSIAYILLVALLMPNLVKQMSLEGPEENAMVFLLVIYHPVALLVVMFAKWLYYKFV